MPVSSVILASRSPARLQLLESAGLEVHVQPTDIQEVPKGRHPSHQVLQLAEDKLQAFMHRYSRGSVPVIAADTLLEFDGHPIGKAENREEAKQLIASLSGHTHRVWSAAAVALPDSDEVKTVLNWGKVHLRDLSDREISWYLDTDEWIGAAGAYRIQERGITLISSIEGDYFSIIGLPLIDLFGILRGQAN
ncbi:MAG: Maf family protein [Spirochaetota bacterium]